MDQEIKNNWRSARFNSSAATPTLRRQTALQQLIERYKQFSRLALVMAGCTPLLIFNILRADSTASTWQIASAVAFIMIYCLMAASMDRWLSKGLSTINVAEMPVVEVCRRAYFYRKRHFQFMAVMIPMCLVMISSLVWMLSVNEYYLYAMAAGAVVGAIAGFRVLSRFLREYKDLTSDD